MTIHIPRIPSFVFLRLVPVLTFLLMATGAVNAVPVQLSPDYEMQRRFEPDWRNPEAVTLPNTPSYAQPKDFQVTLKLGSAPVNGTVYTWVLRQGQRVVTATGANPQVRLTSGIWNATVTGKVGTAVTSAGTLQVDVKDLLIVAIGDSYASGEGVPEIPAFFTIDQAYRGSYTPDTLHDADLNQLSFWDFPSVASLSPAVPESWARSSDPAMTLESRHAHRSTRSYSARYAMALEQSDPHTSVTYVSVAQSAATVSTLLATQNVSADDNVTKMPIQLTELKKIVGNRKIDTLLVSIGGNDLGFGPLIGRILASPVVYAGVSGDRTDPISVVPRLSTNPSDYGGLLTNFSLSDLQTNFTAATAPSISSNVLSLLTNSGLYGPGIRSTFSAVNNATNGLAQSYGALNSYLRSLFRIDLIAITEYPDINRVNVPGSDGQPVLWWGAGVSDVLPSATVNPSEALLATKLFAEPLNRIVSNSAADNGWNYIGGVSDAFAGHGYAAPKGTRWIVTARESVLVEGATPDWYGQLFPLTSYGMAHQASPGLVATARLVASQLGQTNAAKYLSADVTHDGNTIGSGTSSTSVDLGTFGSTNEFLITDTTGQGLGISNVSVSGEFSVAVQPPQTLAPGASATFSIANPSAAVQGVQRGFVTIAFTNQGVPPYIFPVTAYNATASGTNWMSMIPNNSQLSRISLPGTHDTMALYETVPGTAQCQTLTLGEQLTNGVRCLDIRGRHLSNSITIHHGPVYQNANFTDVLNTTTAFLSNNPSETIVMLLKPEWTATRNTRSYEDTVKSYVSKYPMRFFYRGSTLPRLSDVRGKIVLVRRFPGTIGIDADSWPDNPKDIVKVGPYVAVQDHYKFYFNPFDLYNAKNFDEKWSAVYEGLMQASEEKSGKYFCINYGSATILSPVPLLRDMAENMNSRFNGFFKRWPQGNFGAIMLDFATPELIGKIYRSNLGANSN